MVGIEFDAEHQYNTFLVLRRAAPGCIVLLCLVSVAFAVLFFRRVSNPTYQDMANTDQLTGLKSRNAFEVDLKNAISGGTGRGSGLLVADLDRLKQVNDTLGHAVEGPVHPAGRRGAAPGAGEPGDPVPGGRRRIVAFTHRPLRSSWSGTKKPSSGILRNWEDWPVETSFSIGGAMFDPEQDDDLHGTYRRADAGMYEAKTREPQPGGKPDAGVTNKKAGPPW